MGVIYLLYNEKGEGYIGKSTKFNKRLQKHKHWSETSSSTLLGKFEWLILEEVPNDWLDDYEQYYYDLYKEDGLVNKCRPQNTQKEWMQHYQKINREKCNEANRKSYQKHKETRLLKDQNRDKEKRNAREKELYKLKKSLNNTNGYEETKSNNSTIS